MPLEVLSYQSHHTGIETKDGSRTLSSNTPTNRTTLELKLAKNKEVVVELFPTNRTTLELKQPMRRIIENGKITTNRTTLELKHRTQYERILGSNYQSHHTGIETDKQLVFELGA